MNRSNDIQLTDKEVVEDFTQNEEYKKNHKDAAKQLASIFGKNWFTAADVLKKTRIPDEEQATRLLMGLQLFQLCHSKQGGSHYKNKMKFQLMIDPQDKLKVLQDEKKKMEEQLSLIDQEIEKVESEIKLLPTVQE